jgi:hypothetical protein
MVAPLLCASRGPNGAKVDVRGLHMLARMVEVLLHNLGRVQVGRGGDVSPNCPLSLPAYSWLRQTAVGDKAVEGLLA